MNFLSHFARVTTPGRVFLPHIDGLRFIAIMAVLAFHAMGFCAFHFGVLLNDPQIHQNPVVRLFAAGHLGVNLFFVISGFILAVPFAQHALQQKPPVGLRAYFTRRLTRLEPPYIINLAFSFLLCAFVFRHLPSHKYIYENPDWLGYVAPHLVASLFYSNGFIFGAHPYPNIVLWSLEVEVQFYLLMPLFARLFFLRPAWLRRGIFLAVIALVSSLTCQPAHYWVWASLIGNLPYFFVGLLICDFYLTDWSPQTGRHFGADLLFLFSGAAIPLLNGTAWLGLLLPWLLLLFVGASFRGTLCRRLLSRPWVATIGGMCYTIYLYHYFLLSLLIRVTGPVRTHIFWLDLLLQMVLLSLLIVPICALLFLGLERPFMQRDWPARLWKAVRADRDVPAPAA
jgi:peptidoglycan/LPS O-acetylase OafA/YrhL